MNGKFVCYKTKAELSFPPAAYLRVWLLLHIEKLFGKSHNTNMDIPRFEDTITAVSTPPGRAGIGIVRLSGPDALAIVDKHFQPARRDRALCQLRSFTTCYGHLIDGARVVDEVIVTVMRAPHTYTTQDVVEINCHGGIVPVRTALRLMLDAGARLADPGEFTKRAYYFGRIDLAQAEAVADEINAQTEESQAAAISQLSGQLSDEVNSFRENIISLLVQIEASIDFSEHDIELVSRDEISHHVLMLREQISRLLDTAARGRSLRDGVMVAIVGRPNVGKSSLLNALLRANRAIVTHIPGTTRDVVEDEMTLAGVPIRLADTAGIRETQDVIEAEGVNRSRQAIARADLALAVVDGSQPLHPDDLALLAGLDATRSIVVMNKEDLPAGTSADSVAACTSAPVVWLSAQVGTHIQDLEQMIASSVSNGAGSVNGQTVVTNVRHEQALQQADKGLSDAAKAIELGQSVEFVASDLRASLDSLDEIIGKCLPEEIINRIFERFCIGK